MTIHQLTLNFDFKYAPHDFCSSARECDYLLSWKIFSALLGVFSVSQPYPPVGVASELENLVTLFSPSSPLPGLLGHRPGSVGGEMVS